MSLLSSFKRSVAAASIVAAGALSSAGQAQEKPANAQAPQKAPKVAHNSNQKPLTADPANGITEAGILLGNARAYSEDHMVITIAIFKGTRDEQINKKTGKPFTGEEIGEILAGRLRTQGVPRVSKEHIKVFVGQGTGNYTGVAYIIKGRLLMGGIIPLDQAMAAHSPVSHGFRMEYLDELRKLDAERPLALASSPRPAGQD